MKGWAVSTDIDATWVFTENGHRKGPMDGVDGAIKRVCKDISFYPNAVIRNTDQLLKQLPIMENIIKTYNEVDVKAGKKLYPCEKVNLLKIIARWYYFSRCD